MSRIFARIAGLFTSKNFVGADKAGNRYFTKQEQVDGILKEKRWVIFKGEEDPTSIPVEWICWLNGQRKRAPTPEEMMELEARREQVKLNVALLKKEEEEQRAKEGSMRRGTTIGKVGGPDLESLVRQFLEGSEGANKEAKDDAEGDAGFSKETGGEKEPVPESSEPTGSGSSFRPGTWQPPT